MNRNTLTTAVIAGIAGVAGIANMASAVNLNPDGLGQVLLFPYYTVNAGQQTVLSVVNTAAVGKAVKVRFLEGYNSREVLDFNLYLSHFDVWTANVFSLADAGASSAGAGSFAGIFSLDNSCTDPALTASGSITVEGAAHGYQQFLNFKYTGAANSDTGPTADSRTREGHFEMITMGDIDPLSNLATDITHVNGVPPDCTSADLQADSLTGIVPPASGALFGAAAVVNVTGGSFFAYNADAVDAFSEQDLYTGPGNLTPNLQSVNEGIAATVTSYVFASSALNPVSHLVTSIYPNPGAAPGARGIDAVSSLFDAQNVYNQYETAADGSVGTDWVVTFPTKNFYVDAQPGGHLPTSTTAAVPPFENLFDGGEACVTVGAGTAIFDREEGSATTVGCPISPCQGSVASTICLETNVIKFDTNSVLGSGLSPLLSIAPFGGADGWVNLDLSGFGHLTNASNAPSANVFSGLPVTGFEAVKYTNGDVGGVLANYSGVYRHRIFRDCSAGVCS